jgi:FMN phosphatase YigB (HAD superfamily)
MLTMPIKAIAFDLGNTLVHYYEREEFPAVLSDAIRNIYAVIPQIAETPLDRALSLALSENIEQPDARVRPLRDRLQRILAVNFSLPGDLADRACRAFLQPVFNRARKYADCDQTLQSLAEEGFKLAIASNTPWGSPREPWHEELQRHGLSTAVHFSVFCVDVGWRKPAAPIFNRVCEQLQVRPEECMFVGDEPRWDYEGASSVGMRAVLLDRIDKHPKHDGVRVRSLDAVAELARGLRLGQRR